MKQEDPRIRDEELVAEAQRAAELAAKSNDFATAHRVLADVVPALADAGIAAFVTTKLLPAYANASSYLGLAPVGGASATKVISGSRAPRTKGDV